VHGRMKATNAHCSNRTNNFNGKLKAFGMRNFAC